MNEFEKDLDALAKANLEAWGIQIGTPKPSRSVQPGNSGEVNASQSRAYVDPFASDFDPRLRKGGRNKKKVESLTREDFQGRGK